MRRMLTGLFTVCLLAGEVAHGNKADSFIGRYSVHRHRLTGFCAAQKGSILGQRGLYRRGAVQDRSCKRLLSGRRARRRSDHDSRRGRHAGAAGRLSRLHIFFRVHHCRRCARNSCQARLHCFRQTPIRSSRTTADSNDSRLKRQSRRHFVTRRSGRSVDAIAAAEKRPRTEQRRHHHRGRCPGRNGSGP